METLKVEAEEEVDTGEKGPNISQSEVENAIKESRKRKTIGDGEVPGDVLKLLGEGGLKILTKLVNTIYETGEWPKDFTEVTIIALKKKTRATKCSEQRTISLIAHSFIHSVFCLTTGPKPPPKRCLHIVRSRASSFK